LNVIVAKEFNEILFFSSRVLVHSQSEYIDENILNSRIEEIPQNIWENNKANWIHNDKHHREIPVEPTKIGWMAKDSIQLISSSGKQKRHTSIRH
jgi:hypothetical protein